MSSRIAEYAWSTTSRSLLSWDFLCRMVAGSFFVYLAMTNALQLMVFLRQPRTLTALHFGLAVASKLTFIVFLGLNCVMFVLRWRPLSKAEGVLPRVTALAGSFFFFVLAIPRGQPSFTQLVIGSLLLCFGTVSAIIALSRLGRSFSMMAEARRLVTTGAYSIVRHPMYASEQIAIAGIVVQNLSLYAAALFVIHLWIQIQRMKNEERVLQKMFPEYEDYKRRTARLIPLVY
jgi:protein-S-isoprenylcysteine O-methyltransferase Ste14